MSASRCTVVRESSLIPACVVPLKLSCPVIVPPATASFAAKSVDRLVTCDCASVSGSLPALACVEACVRGVWPSARRPDKPATLISSVPPSSCVEA